MMSFFYWREEEERVTSLLVKAESPVCTINSKSSQVAASVQVKRE